MRVVYKQTNVHNKRSPIPKQTTIKASLLLRTRLYITTSFGVFIFIFFQILRIEFGVCRLHKTLHIYAYRRIYTCTHCTHLSMHISLDRFVISTLVFCHIFCSIFCRMGKCSFLIRNLFCKWLS